MFLAVLKEIKAIKLNTLLWQSKTYITYCAKTCQGNAHPINNIHDFFEIKMRKDWENCQSTARNWLDDGDLNQKNNQITHDKNLGKRL